MWQKLNNLIASLRSYPSLSPDIALRRQINRQLKHRHRPALSAEAWYYTYWQHYPTPQPFSKDLVLFVYSRLQDYSGIELGRVHPRDRLQEDLKFPLVCWFDWALAFCDDFCLTFGTDISDDFNEETFTTLADLMLFLQQNVLAMDSLPSQ